MLASEYNSNCGTHEQKQEGVKLLRRHKLNTVKESSPNGCSRSRDLYSPVRDSSSLSKVKMSAVPL